MQPLPGLGRSVAPWTCGLLLQLRALLQGWGAKRGRDDKLLGANLVSELAALDVQADQRQFSEAEWARRYAIKNLVLSIVRSEEQYWHRRGGMKWALKGDANTGYFHAYANGCRRKCAILRLQLEQGLLLSQGDIAKHIYDSYIQLMGSEEPKLAGLRHDLWDQTQCVSSQENEELPLSFFPKKSMMRSVQ